ncbi:MAG: MetQ/NlpA family ABC transporter substrate-binding protein [Succinatimonas sp.]|mgnify:CR=1 FL=1|nr:MetQ/NlpA family ABC transporter substrate-binding protein [Succinatimonas sp.]
MKKFNVLLGVAALSLAFSSQAIANETISVGATPVPHAEILEFVKPILAKEGVDLKIVEFNDYVQPNLATADGQIDANYFQHRPYLEAFRSDRNLDIQEVAAVHIEPMGVYSKSIKDLKDLKDGATVSIPNDPTNGGRALLLLQSAGLIVLEDPTNLAATSLDIKENPKNLEIKELEAPQLPRSLDEVDIAVINTNYAIGAQLNPLEDAIFLEKPDSPYVNILVANPESAKKDGMAKLVKALNSKETYEFIEDNYNGAVIPAF